jgi:hypothetical protein
MIVLVAFILWNILCVFWLISVFSPENTGQKLMQTMTPDQRAQAQGMALMMVIFFWSVSDLVLGTFVLWTRGPRIWTTMDDTAVSPPITVTPKTWEEVKGYSETEQRRAKWSVGAAGAVLALLALVAAAHAETVTCHTYKWLDQTITECNDGTKIVETPGVLGGTEITRPTTPYQPPPLIQPEMNHY